MPKPARRLPNGFPIPDIFEEQKKLLQSMKDSLVSMESENPLQVFRENMESGFLIKAAQTDAQNALNTFVQLYLSAEELKKFMIERGNPP